jgi:hypothetical protein
MDERLRRFLVDHHDGPRFNEQMIKLLEISGIYSVEDFIETILKSSQQLIQMFDVHVLDDMFEYLVALRVVGSYVATNLTDNKRRVHLNMFNRVAFVYHNQTKRTSICADLRYAIDGLFTHLVTLLPDKRMRIQSTDPQPKLNNDYVLQKCIARDTVVTKQSRVQHSSPRQREPRSEINGLASKRDTTAPTPAKVNRTDNKTENLNASVPTSTPETKPVTANVSHPPFDLVCTASFPDSPAGPPHEPPPPEEPHLPVTVNDVTSVSNDTFLLGPTTNHPSTDPCRHDHSATQVSFGGPFPHECMPIGMSLPDHPVPHPGGILPESTDLYYPPVPTAFSFPTASATTNPPSMTNLSRRKGRIKYSHHQVPIQKATNPPLFRAAPKVRNRCKKQQKVKKKASYFPPRVSTVAPSTVSLDSGGTAPGSDTSNDDNDDDAGSISDDDDDPPFADNVTAPRRTKCHSRPTTFYGCHFQSTSLRPPSSKITSFAHIPFEDNFTDVVPSPLPADRFHKLVNFVNPHPFQQIGEALRIHTTKGE